MEKRNGTSVQERRGTKQKRVETAQPGAGYYADPMSPIASTPLKRPRTKAVNSKSVKGKHAPGSSGRPILKTAGASPDPDDQFFSPRKLAKDFDVDEGTKAAADGNPDATATAPVRTTASAPTTATTTTTTTTTTATTTADASPASSHKSEVDEAMFSPSLKPPHEEHGGQAVDETKALGHTSTTADASTSASASTTTTTTTESEGEGTTDELEFNPFVFIKSLPPYEEMAPDGRVPVLPARTKHTPKICLVLDLDETLVHCTVEPIDRPHLQFPVTFNGVDYTVNVKKRPHMDTFLQRAAKRFEVVVFTASHRAYAEQLLNLLDPRRELIKFRLYREDCLEVYGNYLKDLNVLGRDLAQVVLVDNSPHAFGYQVSNGIPIETWYDDQNDEELLNLLPFLEGLVDVPDVRPIVEKQFQMQKLIDAVPDTEDTIT